MTQNYLIHQIYFLGDLNLDLCLTDEIIYEELTEVWKQKLITRNNCSVKIDFIAVEKLLVISI